MNGTELYNGNFERLAKNRINDNSDKQYLNGFYYYLLSDTSYSGAYGYLGRVIDFVNHFKITDPTTVSLDQYAEYLSRIKGKTSSYKIMVYSALKKFSKFLKAKGYADDYMQYISRPKFKESQRTKDKREKGFLTEEEIGILIKEVKNSNKVPQWKARDLAIIVTLLNSGIRCSALQKLDIEDVDIKSKTITVIEKGDVARKIYLSNTAIGYLNEWIEYRDKLVGNTDHALFISDRKRRVDRKTIYNIIKSYGAVIDGKNITPHKTRSTYGTQLYNKTHDVYFVQQCMGHSNPKTTELYIRGQKNASSKKAAELMSGFLD